MWKIKFGLTLFAMAALIIVSVFSLWYDYLEGDWFLFAIDAAVFFLLGDWLWRVFKRQC